MEGKGREKGRREKREREREWGERRIEREGERERAEVPSSAEGLEEREHRLEEAEDPLALEEGREWAGACFSRDRVPRPEDNNILGKNRREGDSSL